jgi:hypothetical protein
VSATVADRSKRLPAQFAELQPLGDEWIQWDDASRIHKQVTTGVEELAAFYNAVAPRAGEIYDYLARVPLDDDMADEDTALLALAIVLAEIADGVEYYSPHSTGPVHMPRWEALHDSILGWQTT